MTVFRVPTPPPAPPSSGDRKQPKEVAKVSGSRGTAAPAQAKLAAVSAARSGAPELASVPKLAKAGRSDGSDRPDQETQSRREPTPTPDTAAPARSASVPSQGNDDRGRQPSSRAEAESSPAFSQANRIQREVKLLIERIDDDSGTVNRLATEINRLCDSRTGAVLVAISPIRLMVRRQVNWYTMAKHYVAQPPWWAMRHLIYVSLDMPQKVPVASDIRDQKSAICRDPHAFVKEFAIQIGDAKHESWIVEYALAACDNLPPLPLTG
jgi:hypothetical protein